MSSTPPPPAGSDDLADELRAFTPEADWHRDGDTLRCSLGHGSVTVRPAPNGGWEVAQEQDGQTVDRQTIHGGLDGTAARQVADVILGWGG